MNNHLKTVLRHLIKYCDLHKILENTFLIVSTVSIQNCARMRLNCFCVLTREDLLSRVTSKSGLESHDVRMESKLSLRVRGVLDEAELAFEGKLSRSGGLCCRTWCGCCWYILVGVDLPESFLDLLLLPRP